MNAADLIEDARNKGIMLATAESCTGGLVAGAITDVPGSSDVFERGFVTYSNAAKTEMLGVAPALIDRHGAVSEEVAAAMAEGALEHSSADLTVSVTGVAGPGASARKPEGMVCFGVAMKSGGKVTTSTQTVQFGALGRTDVRRASVDCAINLLNAAVDALPIF